MKLCTTCGARLEDHAEMCTVCHSPLFAVASSPGLPARPAVRPPAPAGGYDASEDDDFDDFDEAEPTLAMSANDAVSALLAQAAAGARRPVPKPDKDAIDDATAVLTADALASLSSNPHLHSLPSPGAKGDDEADPTMMMDAGDQNAYLAAARALAAQHDAQYAAGLASTQAMEPVSVPAAPAAPPAALNVSSLIADVLGDAAPAPRAYDHAPAPLQLSNEPTSSPAQPISPLHAVTPPSGVPMPPPRKSGGGKGIVIGLAVVVVLLLALAAGAWFVLPMVGVELPF